ncbi:MAG: pantoate--beta-alanine ligase [Candidatus Brocadia sp.]|nr:Pantothenate synthetase [Candidatus Brocadia fulgida]MCC6326085.1 pantoate--beta-alanine ligase [Candidatus Brocadia sp.]MCE7910772.1 pantoate--beta-alanine ligase [Candidatus Brocadia sp. AMX3]MDG5996250.1 pantoate--beta-alanine ligase [Candidatus Brocadia sp.]RIK01857.1 MAG: pantoate--beta-alanine ligase [Candidatus Brocadia sp.]
MQVITAMQALRQHIRALKENRSTIGLVPTMGALHEGHLSLVREAKKENDAVAVSIFVNPLQFGKNEDFTRYPRTFGNDCNLLSQEGVNIVFNPGAAEMYPQGFCTAVVPESLEDKLCGKSRPGHFRGVAVAVLKLFNLIQPDIAYFGQKDFQQTVVIKRIVSDLSAGVTIKVLPTIRDQDGLALSSRNAYLSETERNDALCLYTALTKAKAMVNTGMTDTEKILREMEEIITRCKSATIDYIAIVNPETLGAVPKARNGDVVALAVRIGKTRLIDNVILILMIALCCLGL